MDQQQAVLILKQDENGRKVYALAPDTRKRFFVGGKRSHGLIGADDPDMSELLCKQIKLEQPDIDDQSVDTEAILPEEACTLVAEFRDDTEESIVPDDAIAEVVMGQEVITGSELELVQAEEVVTSLAVPGGTDETVDGISSVAAEDDDEDDDGDCIRTSRMEQPTEGDDEAAGVLMQHMDIREPLSTLRTLLEQRLGVELAGYQFWLQDAQMLEGHKNLVDQCVQGEGLVQVNVQIKTDGNIKKINIVDVLKPAEEYVEIAEEQYDTAVQKQTYQAPESKHNVIRWVVDSHFKKEQERLKIPTGVDILRGI